MKKCVKEKKDKRGKAETKAEKERFDLQDQSWKSGVGIVIGISPSGVRGSPGVCEERQKMQDERKNA